jgi:uncharacterized protein with PQ loop repeat
MDVISVVGIAAACCTTGAFVHQVAKTWRPRSAADISGHMFAIIGVNAVSLLLTLTMLALKLRHG